MSTHGYPDCWLLTLLLVLIHVLVAHEAELRERLSTIRPNQTILLNTSLIYVSEPVILNSTGITIKGHDGNRTTIQCSDALTQSAFVVREGGIQFRDVTITRCHRDSAVVVYARSGLRENRMNVTFTNVTFHENGERKQGIQGAAVRSAACPEEFCDHRVLAFHTCSFTRNRGMFGGALFLEDTNVIIQNSRFVGNDADLAGGAVYMRNQLRVSLFINGSHFENNWAHADEDVHHTDETVLLTTTNETMAAFGMGGAIHAFRPHRMTIDATTFTYNIGCRGGGAVAVFSAALDGSDSSQFFFHLSNSRFHRNCAYCGTQTDAMSFTLAGRNANHGGAVLYEHLDDSDTNWTLVNSTFHSNRAHSGGGLAVESMALPSVDHTMSGCFFDGNVGLVSGGGFSAISVRLTMMNTTVRNSRATYGGGILVWRGSIFTSLRSPEDPAALNIVEGNTGIFGGGMYVDAAGNIDLAGIVIRNNTALRHGGGFRFFDVAASVVMRGVIIEGNRALAGGGIAILALSRIKITSDNGKPSIIRSNIAGVGGGLYYEPGHTLLLSVAIENTDFVGNRALSLGNPEMTELVMLGNAYQPLSSAGVRMPDIDEQLGEFSLYSFLTDVSDGHGGGICITLIDIRLFTIIEVVFQNVTLVENEAVVGGGISAHMTDLYWNRASRASCFSSALGLDTCQRFILHNVTVVKNRAYYAGGMFATLPEGIAASCGPGNNSRITSVDLVAERGSMSILDAYCSNVVDNEISDGADIEGANGGTNAVFLAVEGWEGNEVKQVASGEQLVLPCEDQTASCTRPLLVAVKDVFGQTIVRGIEDAELTLELTSKNVVGDLRYTAVNGIAVINNTMAWGVGISGNITIVSEQDRDIRLELHFSTRECYPGEFHQDNVCRRCPSEQYGFDPSIGSCHGCEENARCAGGAALVPSNGYWHSTPFSPLMHKCINPNACKYDDRERILTEFYDDGARLDEDLRALDVHIAEQGPRPDFPEYRQCAEGYEGVLCGSCQDGYGHSFTDTCTECPENRATDWIFIFLGTIWLLALIGANCAVTLISKNDRVNLVKHELRSAAHGRHRRLLRSRQITADPNRKRRVHEFTRQQSGSSREDQLDQQLHETLARQLVATVQLTETLKIFINYTQVTSVALHLQTDWNPLLRGLLTTEAGFLGLPEEIVQVPFECNFDYDAPTPASISALWIRLALPWIILVALCFFFFVYWCVGYALRRRKDSLSHTTAFDLQQLFTSLIVISVVSVYFSYIDIVQQLLKTVNCVEVEEASEYILSDHPYGKYVIDGEEQNVWAEDTDVTCFEGKHLPVGIVGIIGLFLSFCGIILIIVWLPLNRKHVTRTDFVSRYWFLYQAYRKEWYTNAWESTILIRKSLIAAVIVFSVHLGPTLQASLCTGILALAHIMHSFLSPFKIPENHEYVPEYAGDLFRIFHLPKFANRWVVFNNSVHLNNLESASLASSMMFFFSVIVLHDSGASVSGRFSMVAFTFALNAVFLLYIIYRIYAGLHVSLDLKLEIRSPAFMAKHENKMSFWSLVRKIVESIRTIKTSVKEDDGMTDDDPTLGTQTSIDEAT